MNSQQLLYINLGLGLFFVLYFFFFRTKPKGPTRLNLRGGVTGTPQATDETQERAAKVAEVLEAKPQLVLEAKPQLVLEAKPQLELEAKPQVESYDRPALPIASPKKSEVFFIYNAHEWEAHEVLGLPRGASFQQVTERYQILIKTSDGSSFEFYEAAFKAILKKKETL